MSGGDKESHQASVPLSNNEKGDKVIADSGFENVCGRSFQKLNCGKSRVGRLSVPCKVGFLESEEEAVHGTEIIIGGFEFHPAHGSARGLAIGKKDSAGVRSNAAGH
jgi:hypothetical protein